MIKDGLFKLMLLPLLGLFIPLIAGIDLFHLLPTYLVLSVLFFTGVFVLISRISIQIICYLRRQSMFSDHLFRKIILLPIITSVAGSLLFFVSLLLWELILKQSSQSFVLRSMYIVGTLFILVSLIYEIIFLTAEKNLEGIVLRQIDTERINAELNILKNELDPHFFFNCLTTLTHLVQTDADKAYHFIYKLSSVYKYFLINKAKDLVTLKEEVDFLENYYYLLKVRFENSIHIEYVLDDLLDDSKVLPCTLQALLENAIKHNFFSENDPLFVTISATKNHLIVSNPIRPKMYSGNESTRIGLKNLKTRYRHVLNKDIVIQTFQNKFSVKLPIVKMSES